MRKLKRKLKQLKIKFDVLIRGIFVWVVKLTTKKPKIQQEILYDEADIVELLADYIEDQKDTEQEAISEYVQNHGYEPEDPVNVVYEYCLKQANDFLDEYFKRKGKH